jgi:rhodanese-related sulfurtransferase
MLRPAGIPSVDVREADRRRSADDAILVDVRERNEFLAVRADGVALMPLSTFAVRFDELPKDRPLLIICHTGNRSLAATAHLIRNGWTNVANVVGGMDAWQAAGLPTRSGPAEDGEGTLPTR